MASACYCRAYKIRGKTPVSASERSGWPRRARGYSALADLSRGRRYTGSTGCHKEILTERKANRRGPREWQISSGLPERHTFFLTNVNILVNSLTKLENIVNRGQF